MSLIDYDKLNAAQLISQFIVESRGTGHCLGYDDHLIIDEWLQAAPNTDALLLILADTVPDYFHRPGKKAPLSLRGLRRRILTKLRASAMRGGISANTSAER